MPNEQRIRALARSVLQAGGIPRHAFTNAERVIDFACAICGERIRPDQVEYEVQFAHDGVTPGVDLFHLHLRCFAAWELERTKAAPGSDTP